VHGRGEYPGKRRAPAALRGKRRKTPAGSGIQRQGQPQTRHPVQNFRLIDKAARENEGQNDGGSEPGQRGRAATALVQPDMPLFILRRQRRRGGRAGTAGNGSSGRGNSRRLPVPVSVSGTDFKRQAWRGRFIAAGGGPRIRRQSETHPGRFRGRRVRRGRPLGCRAPGGTAGPAGTPYPAALIAFHPATREGYGAGVNAVSGGACRADDNHGRGACRS